MKFDFSEAAQSLEQLTSRLKAVWRLEPQSADLGQRRISRAKITGVATIGVRGLMFLVGLLSLPLASHYLGKERFGLWLTLIGLVNWFGLADLGLANSLINTLSTADGSGDRRLARVAVASATAMVIGIIAILLSAFIVANPFIDWAEIFNVSSPQARSEAAVAFAVVIFCFALRMLASIVASVYAAYQEGHLYQIWSALCSLISVIGLIVAIWAQGGLPTLIGSFVGGWLLGEALSAFYLFGWRRPDLRPSWRYVDWSKAKTLLSGGVELWLAQISAILLFQTDLIIVAHLFGASSVAGYGTALRLFSIVGVAQAAFTTPLWAAYSESLARRDIGWLERTFERSIRLSLLWSAPATIVIALGAGWLFDLLVTSDIQPESSLLIPMMATEIINSAARCLAILLNGIGATRSQAIFGPVASVLNLALSWYLGKAFGPAGVAWATAICLGSLTLFVLRRDAKRRLSKLRQAF